jgi:hypothetical protein
VDKLSAAVFADDRFVLNLLSTKRTSLHFFLLCGFAAAGI